MKKKKSAVTISYTLGHIGDQSNHYEGQDTETLEYALFHDHYRPLSDVQQAGKWDKPCRPQIQGRTLVSNGVRI